MNGIDRYRIDAPLGRGRLGELFAGIDREQGLPVVIRELASDLVARPARLHALRDQMSVLVNFDDPACARVLYYAETTRGVFVVSERVDGVSLAALLSRPGGLSPEQATAIALRVLGGLEHAHTKGLVHGDVRPENVLVDELGNVKITDFGLGRLGDASAAPSPFTSPEEATGAPLDHRADLYAAAGLLLAGLGWPGPGGDDDVLVKVAQLARALDPADRPYTAEELILALEGAAEKTFGAGWRKRGMVLPAIQESRSPAPAPPVATPATGQYYRHEWVILAVATAMVALLLGGGSFALARVILPDAHHGETLGIATSFPPAAGPPIGTPPVPTPGVSPVAVESAAPSPSPTVGATPRPQPSPTKRPSPHPSSTSVPPPPPPTAPPTEPPSPSPQPSPSPPPPPPSPSPSP